MAEAHARVAQELDTARRVGTAEVWRCGLGRTQCSEQWLINSGHDGVIQ
jgi:hypothetical protein